MKNFLLALGLNLLLLVAIEAGFRIFASPPATTFFIPGKDPGTLVVNETRFNPRRNNAVNPVSISAKKPPGTSRIFLTGDSTAAGLHYNPHATIARFLELGLRDVLPGKKVEVVNAGLGGKSSDTVAAVFQELLRYEPDLIIVYSGQNEFLEPNIRRFREARLHPTHVALKSIFLQSAAFAWLDDQITSRRESRPPLPQVENQMIGASLAGEDFVAITTAYEDNLRQMARIAKAQAVPSLFLTLVSNLRDFEPNVSYFSKGVGPADAERFVLLVLAAKAAIDENRLDDALPSLTDAGKIDSEVAEWQWQRARLADKLGQWDEADAAYQRASSLDGKPWRNLPEFSETVRRVTASEATLLYDVNDRFRLESPHGLIGNNLIIDNCHPTLQGQYLIAGGILATLAANGLFAPQEEWQLDRFRDEAGYLRELIPGPKTLAESYFRTGAYNLAWALLRYDKRPRLLRARDNFNAALERWADYPQALYARAQVDRALGESDAAELFTQKARALSPTIEIEYAYLAKLVDAIVPGKERSLSKAR